MEPLNLTIYNEFIHERKNEFVGKIYLDEGIRHILANGVRWAKFAGNSETVGIGGCFHTEQPLETLSEKDYEAGDLDHPDMG